MRDWNGKQEPATDGGGLTGTSTTSLSWKRLVRTSQSIDGPLYERFGRDDARANQRHATRGRPTDTFDRNVRGAGHGWPPVVIASAFKTGVLVARSLERRGLKVLLVDCNPKVEGFRSIHGTTLLCPNPDEAPDAWFKFMSALSTRLGQRPALLAASDQFVSAIGRFADALADHYYVSPSAKLQAELADKEGQLRLAEQFGLPTPRTVFAKTRSDVETFAQQAKFPVLIKPRQHRFWCTAPTGHPMHQVKVVQADNQDALLHLFDLALSLGDGAVLQERIPGPETNKRVHVAVYRRDGNRLAHLTLKELRCTRFGVPTVCEPIRDARVAETCDAFFRASGYRGTCEIELMWDERDKTPKMMDINPRFSGSGDAVTYAGIDQAWLTYLDLTGEAVHPVAPPHREFRHVMLENDTLAIRQYWQDRKLRLADLRATYQRPVYFWDVEPADWRLATTTAMAVLRSIAGTLLCVVLNRRR